MEDEAAYLTERSRAGLLPFARVELAAFLGHEAARLSLGDRAPEPVVVAGDKWLLVWSERLRRLAAWDSIVYARAALAAMEASPAFGDERRRWRDLHPQDGRPEEAVSSLEAFVLCPCAAHDARRRAGNRLAHQARYDPRVQYGPDRTDFFNGYLLAVWEATNQESLYDLLHTLAEPTPNDQRRLANAVAGELVSWVLGVSDPARERASARANA